MQAHVPPECLVVARQKAATFKETIQRSIDLRMETVRHFDAFDDRWPQILGENEVVHRLGRNTTQNATSRTSAAMKVWSS